MDIKAQVIQEYLAGGTSYRQLSAKYGMSRDVINKWVMIYQGIHNLPLTEKQYSLSNRIQKNHSIQDYYRKKNLILGRFPGEF